MGIRVNALFDHDLSDFHAAAESLDRLAHATPAAVAFHDYWLTADPEASHGGPSRWEAEPADTHRPGLRRYSGPGGLSLTVTPRAARLRAGGRWRTFLAIEAMRRVHHAALRAVAGAMGADHIEFHPDSDEVNDLFWAGRPRAECVQWMREHWGPPQGRVEMVAPDLVARAELYLPAPVWFSEEVDRGALRLL